MERTRSRDEEISAMWVGRNHKVLTRRDGIPAAASEVLVECNVYAELTSIPYMNQYGHPLTLLRVAL